MSPDFKSTFVDPEDSAIVAQAKREPIEPVTYSYTERDVILYNLGIGATEKELQWTYEGNINFSALPTFGAIPQFLSGGRISLDWLPNYNPAMLLHGEHYLRIKAPIPTSGELINEVKLLEALDKGKDATVTAIIETRDKSTGQVIFENQSTAFVRGAGGFGGKRNGNDRGAATAANTPPNRAQDAAVEEKTTLSQAALYRLSGDTFPLHILPEFAVIAGFKKPTLQGLCSFGFAGKHILKTYGAFSDIKARFAGVAYPGETLITQMWKEGNKVIFNVKAKERDAIVLSAAAATLVQSNETQQEPVSGKRQGAKL